MTQSDQLNQQVKFFYGQIALQKSLRLTLRAVWMGLAAVLLCWGVNALWGYLPNPLTWFSIGLGVALLPVIAVMVSLYPVLTDLPPPQRWIYAVDSRLNQHGQLSTAWEISRSKPGGPVADLLVQDMLVFLPRARADILKGGWVSKRDLAAAGVTALMSVLLLAATLLQPDNQPALAPSGPAIPQTSTQQPQEQAPAPAPDQQPNEPGAQPGDAQNGDESPQEANNPGENAAGGETSTGAMPDSSAGADPGAVAGTLRQLGSQLSQQAGTFGLGQALENLELDSAADELESVAEQANELSPESRENMAQALEDAANNLNDANSPSVAEDMQDAAGALQDPEAALQDALGQVAQDLRELNDAMQAMQADGGGGGAGQGESAEAEQAMPADRLPYESGQMEIPLDDTDQSDLLSPADPDAPADGTASGSLDANRPQQNPVNQSPLLPNAFLWKWRNVVSQYFQR